jgi:hypothetical protein
MIDIARQKKISAKKMHYYALAGCMSRVIDSAKKMVDAAQALSNAGISDKSNLLKVELLANIMTEFTPMYQVAYSLRSYKESFGEYPEWTNFFVAECLREGVSIEAFIDGAIDQFRSFEETFGHVFSHAGTSPHAMAFGDSFIEMSEKIKIKGEE